MEERKNYITMKLLPKGLLIASALALAVSTAVIWLNPIASSKPVPGNAKPAPQASITKPEILETAYKLAIANAKPYIPETIIKNIVNTAYKTDNPLLLLALITEESHFDIFAKSRQGAVGCAQIVPKVWEKELKKAGLLKGYRDYFDPEKSVLIADYIITRLIKKQGDVKKALMSYQCGNRYKGRRCKRYAEAVLARYGEYVIAAKLLQDNKGKRHVEIAQ